MWSLLRRVSAYRGPPRVVAAARGGRFVGSGSPAGNPMPHDGRREAHRAGRLPTIRDAACTGAEDRSRYVYQYMYTLRVPRTGSTAL